MGRRVVKVSYTLGEVEKDPRKSSQMSDPEFGPSYPFFERGKVRCLTDSASSRQRLSFWSKKF